MIIIIGDLNTIAWAPDFTPLCFNAIKEHSLGLRSILNDDVIPENLTGNCNRNDLCSLPYPNAFFLCG